MPEGRYYCKECGPSAIMVELTQDNLFNAYARGIKTDGVKRNTKREFSECFDEVARKYQPDERVSEMLKKIGPAFPLPGPHYDYVDLIEHMRYSLAHLCACDPDGLPEYHLLEVYNRRRKLAEKARDIRILVSERDYEYFRNHIHDLVKEWEKDFKKYFNECVCKSENRR